MTFEEFLIKKKIDPVQLKNTELAFFSEFNNLFNEMGEKASTIVRSSGSTNFVVPIH